MSCAVHDALDHSSSEWRRGRICLAEERRQLVLRPPPPLHLPLLPLLLLPLLLPLSLSPSISLPSSSPTCSAFRRRVCRGCTCRCREGRPSVNHSASRCRSCSNHRCSHSHSSLSRMLLPPLPLPPLLLRPHVLRLHLLPLLPLPPLLLSRIPTIHSLSSCCLRSDRTPSHS